MQLKLGQFSSKAFKNAQATMGHMPKNQSVGKSD